MAYEKLTFKLFVERLQAGDYNSSTGAKRAVSRAKDWSDREVSRARAMLAEHFGEELEAAPKAKKEKAPKAEKAPKKVAKKAGKKLAKKVAAKQEKAAAEPAAEPKKRGRKPKNNNDKTLAVPGWVRPPMTKHDEADRLVGTAQAALAGAEVAKGLGVPDDNTKAIALAASERLRDALNLLAPANANSAADKLFAKAAKAAKKVESSGTNGMSPAVLYGTEEPSAPVADA